MYVPPHAREERLDVLHDAIAHIAFGTLVTVRDAAPVVSQLPMLLVPNGERGTLIGHVSRANPQWTSGGRASAAFVGPQFYVSPSAYATKQLTGMVVPTWNYIAVEAQGTIEFFDDAERVLALVRRLTDHHEGPRANPWSVDDAPDEYIAAQLRGIVGFELTIDQLIGAWKLSGNRTAADRAGVAGLMDVSDEPGVRDLADRVRTGPA
jgi:transcriptional regulator